MGTRKWRCERCFGGPSSCLCEGLVPVVTRTRFLLLQHVLEVPKVSNTGRIAALGLRSLERVTYAREPTPADLDVPGTWLLFPGGTTQVPEPPPARVVVLDASWSQARHMVQRVPALRALPRFSLEVTAPEPSLRRAPAGGLSTLQAIARCVERLEGASAAAPLQALHDRLVARALAARGYL
jgi:DTW domain-containing protein